MQHTEILPSNLYAAAAMLKETNSRWSDKVYTIEKTDRDMTLQKYYLLEGLKRRYLHHELLMVDD